ncbi:dipeptide ABC transporter ATP-binding protein [Streptomyces sp. NRRL S-37]|uniref:dipeptide ABC transporter ATP-binding protein n=1 Tax=Streptomyces sp. NRRL S-37 TaxID=1463903 RepID=UPI0004C52CFA|nr:dipeptide ABC transporter ATP-binding protein [Streptomyces sp. NRRL S-37]
MSETKKTDATTVPAQAAAPEEREVLLKVEGLQKHFPIRKGVLRRQVGAVKAVDGIDFEVRKGETLGVVGESGCGKSTMGRVITRLQDPTGGSISFEGKDITRLNTAGMRPLRRDIQMIFQDPYGSLNPRHTIGGIVSAPFRLQGVEPEGGVKKEVQRLLELVGLSPEHYNRYPHEFSGGQRQRIGIARALALKPKLVVADEPVSALDVSIQAQVVNLMDDLQEELGLTYVIIAHDLSVVRHVSDRIAVMYLGKIVELADRTSLYETPMHPYTKALMSAVPVPDPKRRGTKSERILLRGDVPSPISPPSGCRFHTRCWKATQICTTTEPPLKELRPGQRVACHHPENFADQAPQDVVLLTAAKEAAATVPQKAPAKSAETSKSEETSAGAAADAEGTKPKASEPEAEAGSEAKPAEAESEAKPAEAETKAGAAEAESEAGQAEAESEVESAEAETKAGAAEAESEAGQAEAESEAGQAEAESEVESAEAETKTEPAEAESEAGQAEAESEAGQAEAESEAVKAEAAASGPAETDAPGTDTDTDAGPLTKEK